MVTNLRETYKDVESRAKALKESVKKTYDKDTDIRTIARDNQLLVKLFGEKKAVDLAESMFEPERFGEIREGLFEAERKGELRETNALTAFNTLMRLGVQDLLAKAWLTVPMVGDQLRRTASSTAFVQPYAGTFRPGLPNQTGIGEEFSETSVQGYGALIENVKFGKIISYQQEALDDDQTGELQMKVEEVGVNMGIYEELAFAAVLSDTALTQASLTFTPLTYTDPDGTTGVYKSSGNRQNRPASFGAISVGTLKTAKQVLKKIKQPDGQLVLVNPNSVVYHPDDEQIVDIILKSPNFPSPIQANTAYGAPTGQVFAINPIQGMYQKYECRYLTSSGNNGGAWFLMESKKPVVWQERTGLMTVQEAPNSGTSFNRMLARWRVSKRGQMFMYPGASRFTFQGNDGN